MMYLVAGGIVVVVSSPLAFAKYIRRTLLTEVRKRAVLGSRDGVNCWPAGRAGAVVMVWLNRSMRMRMLKGGVRVQVVEGEDAAVGGVKDSSLQG